MSTVEARVPAWLAVWRITYCGRNAPNMFTQDNMDNPAQPRLKLHYDIVGKSAALDGALKRLKALSATGC
eukprot:14311909-Alexandrium_andersonii.AAC.1